MIRAVVPPPPLPQICRELWEMEKISQPGRGREAGEMRVRQVLQWLSNHFLQWLSNHFQQWLSNHFQQETSSAHTGDEPWEKQSVLGLPLCLCLAALPTRAAPALPLTCSVPAISEPGRLSDWAELALLSGDGHTMLHSFLMEAISLLRCFVLCTGFKKKNPFFPPFSHLFPPFSYFCQRATT